MINRRTLYVWLGAGVVASALGGVFFRHFRRTEARAAAGKCAGVAPKTDATKWKPIEHRSVAPTVFPLHPVEGQRYLVDAADRPFLIVGDSAWSLLTQLSTEDAELYLSDRQSKGFNTLLVNLLEHKFADNAPRNAYGDGPFRQDDDFSTADDSYFDHAEQVLRSAGQKGFLVLLAPAYTGAGGGDDGWYRAMEASGLDKLRDYGRYVGKRFKDFKNIIWVHVGDFNPPNKTLSQAVADGIREILPQSLHTAHNGPGMHGLGYWSASEIPHRDRFTLHLRSHCGRSFGLGRKSEDAVFPDRKQVRKRRRRHALEDESSGLASQCFRGPQVKSSGIIRSGASTPRHSSRSRQ